MTSSGNSINELISLLQTQDPHQGHRAAEALARIGLPAIEPLLDVLRDWRGGQEDLRAYWAVEAFSQIGLPAVEPLIAALGEDDPAVRGYAATALGRIGARQAVDPLVHVLRTDTAKPVRIRAAEALGWLGDERAVGALITELNDPGEYVESYAINALVTIGEPSILPLITALEDDTRSTQVRMNAAYTLGKLRDRRAVAPLASILLDSAAPLSLRRVAATEVAKFNNAQASSALLQVLRQRDEESRLRSFVARVINDPHVFAFLHAILEDPHEDVAVRRAVTGTLCRLDTERAVKPLIDALNDAEPPVRIGAALALGRCGDARALSALEQLQRQGAEPGTNIASVVQRSIIAIKRRLRLPLTPDEDPVAKVVARYGPFSINLLKHDVNRPPDKMHYVLRLDNAGSAIDIGTISAMKSARADILDYLHSFLEDEQLRIQRMYASLQEAQDLDLSARRREVLAKTEQRSRLVESAMHEIETEQQKAPE